MKIQVPVVAAIGQAVLGSVLEPEDSSLKIPATILLTAESLLPTIVATQSNQPYPVSHVSYSVLARNNQVAASQTVVTLEKGYWHLAFTVSVRFNYTATGIAVSDLDVLLSMGLFSISMYHRFSSIGSFVDSFERELMLTERATIVHGVGATGAAENLESYVMLNSSKRL